MTEQRALKQLVRERMERTGESYATAHARVVARKAPPSVDGVTPGYPAFGAEAHRPSAHAQHLLAQAGVPVSEAMACGLGGGIGFMYAVFEYKQVPHPLLTIVAQHHPQPWLEAVAEHLGITLSSATSSSPTAAMTKLDATLERGQAAQLTVGRELLPWHENVPAEEAAAPYEVVVAGREGGDYLVDDGSDVPYRLAAAQLSEAWAAHRKGRFAVVTVDPVADGVDFAATVRAAIGTTVSHLTGPVLGNSFDVNFGLSGMAKFLDELRDARTKSGWLKRFGSPEAFRIGMTRLGECLTWQYTSEGGTRPLYSRFLAEAGPVTGLDLVPASVLAQAAGEVWRTVAETARMAAGSGSDPAETFSVLADQVEVVLETERSLVRALESALA